MATQTLAEIERLQRELQVEKEWTAYYRGRCDTHQIELDALNALFDAEREKRWEGNRIASEEKAAEVRSLQAELDALRSSVPELLTPDGKYGKQHHYAEGWNDCIDAMLAAKEKS